MMPFKAIVCCSLALCVTSAWAQEKKRPLLPGGPIRVSKLVEAYDEIALKREYDKNALALVLKWRGPIIVQIDDQIGPARINLSLVQAHLDQMTRSYPFIKLAGPGDVGNLTIHFVLSKDAASTAQKRGASNLIPLLNQSPCPSSIKRGPDGAIISGLIIIQVDRARQLGRLPACVVEEITQATGLVNDSEKVFPSIFNDKSIDVDLTRLDHLLLKIHADPRITAGMTREQVLPIVEKISLELLNHSKLD